jgi:hypothetical protein
MSITLTRTTTQCLLLVKKKVDTVPLQGPLKDLNQLLKAVEDLANPNTSTHNDFIDAVRLYRELKGKYVGNCDVLNTLDCVKKTLNQIFLIQQQLIEMRRTQNMKLVFGPDSDKFKL